MSEELLQRDLLENPEKIGTWNFYNIGSTTIKDLAISGIIRRVDYGSVSNKKPDALITKGKEVIAIIENKQPKEFNTKKKQDNAIRQEIEVAKALQTKLLIATDTQETIWVNVLTGNKIKDKDGNEFKYNFDKTDNKLQKIITEIIQSINKDNDKIIEQKLVEPTDLAKQVWQDIWVVSGATPENCLYTFVELFIFKYLSDLNILTGMYNFYYLYERYKDNSEDQVLQNYVDNIRPKMKRLFPESPVDKTTIINGTIFVSKDKSAVSGYGTVFRKVLERFYNYGELKNIDHDFKSKLFESFLKESISKKNWGQFFTPIKVVRSMVKMAGEVKEGMTICDPACGVGKFLLEFIKDDINKLYTINENKNLESKVKIVGFDKGFTNEEQKTIILAKANMLIYFCDLIKENTEQTTQFADLFNNSFLLETNSILGTLSRPEKEKYDLILTNPPYVMNGSSNLKAEIAKRTELKNYFKINACGVEGLFMEWIVRALKKNGKAFIVVPDGFFNRQNDKNLRKFMLENCFIDAIISLPIKTFFTTQKKTYILAITKKNDISQIQMDPVFTYLCSEIGESRDVNRFEIDKDDLKEAVSLFNFFKGNKTEFAKINNDKRCKIQPINRFINNIEKQWIIDKDWSDKEKVELGIVEKEKAINLTDFNSYLQSAVDNITNNQEEINEIDENCNICKYIEVAISTIFDIEKGKAKYTKKYINNYKGKYPVYSSQTTNDGIIGSINTFDYNCECITWTTDGTYVGTTFLRNGKFSMTTHCGGLLLKEKYKNAISLQYINYVLNNTLSFHKVGEGSNKRLGKEIIKDITIKIPVLLNGEFDLHKQLEIAEKYRKIDEIKVNIKNELDRISNIKIDFNI